MYIWVVELEYRDGKDADFPQYFANKESAMKLFETRCRKLSADSTFHYETLGNSYTCVTPGFIVFCYRAALNP